MTVLEHAKRLLDNLLQLGARKLATLGLIGVAVFGVTGIAGYYLSRPTDEVLYTGLDRQDVNRIGSTLREAGIGFDVNADSNTVYVRAGQAAEARMLLAEKGLPHSANAGYELFDKLGSLGLTSFMQEVTRARALEGELARTIQTMNGVKAARVHIVLPDPGSFRRNAQPPSASVVVRMESADDAKAAQAIRRLVAGAVPGMTVEEVTVLSTDGTLLASGEDTAEGGAGRMLGLEKTVSREIQDNIRKTLVPYLGLRNFQVSVAAKLNTDTRQTAETIYNPDSRVERSVRVVKESQNSQNSSSQPSTSVTQNLPQQAPPSADGKQSTDVTQKKEELTNYELSSKTVTTVSAGYGIEGLSVAVLVNRSALTAGLGDKAPAEALAKKLADIEQLIASAAGIHKERGDNVKVSAVDFVDAGLDLQPVPAPTFGEIVMRQSGTLINAATILVVAGLLIFFGFRPATRLLLADKNKPVEMLSSESDPASALAITENFGDNFVMPELTPMSEEQMLATAGEMPQLGAEGDQNLIEELMGKPKRLTQRRLEQMVEFDEEQAAAILKAWVHEGLRG